MTMRSDFYDEYDMLPDGTAVLCAISGGADSVFLLHWLLDRKEQRHLTVYAAHYEHGIRGAESARDAGFVSELCEKLGVTCVIGHGNVSEYAAAHHLGTEEAARELRYAFLESSADSFGCSRIATAHTAEDNAETILLNLCRGSGTRGLAGIPPVRGRLIRPLLQTDRETIERYLREHEIQHVEDSTNQKDCYTRNRLRHRVLPLLKEENPAFLVAAARTAQLTRMDDDCLNRMAEQFLTEHFSDGSIPTKALCLMEPAIAARVLRLLCGSGLSMERTQALLRFAEGTEAGVLEIPGKKIYRKRGRLYFPERN
ncbi:MAG: tRNA lysidine(34) synthetase TilS [Oscillospiraceae bacterium]|nr:tRNA lysidine(34) synthetase TilS [Oscillospiraceae bacterium]